MRRTEITNVQVIPSPTFGDGFGLDFAGSAVDAVGMRKLLCALAAILLAAGSEAAVIRLDGTLTCKIAKPDCTFKLDGGIQNLSPTTSGTIKIALWATPAAFPSRGYMLAERNLGQLSGGYQFNSFKHKTGVTIPDVDGRYYFTIAILEYTYSGWQTRDYVSIGRKLLGQGELLTGAKWPLPAAPVIAPPASLKAGTELTLNVRADEDLDGIVKGTWAKTNMEFRKRNKTIVTVSGDESDWIRSYSTAKRTLVNTKVPVGKLELDPEEDSGSSTITLYFQSPTGGFYKHVRTDSKGGFSNWGTFSLKGAD